jgi:hypothetical protein
MVTQPIPSLSVYLRGVGRLHLFEFHEMPWFPAGWRDLITDFLSFYATAFKPYEKVAPLLAEALKRSGATRIVDLCSGAGRPLLSLVPALRALDVDDLEVVLTDKYPNRAALDRGGHPETVVEYLQEPVDATDLPADLHGFRTLFTSFHHLRPDAARRVLANAVNDGEGIGIFEYTERNWLIWTFPILVIPIFVWLCTPLIRPFNWGRLLWTYVVPVVPFVAMWDGFVSNLRTYSVRELHRLVGTTGNRDYEWKIGRAPSIGASHVTYAIGTPIAAISSSV